jgi:cytochrome c oxidase subunit 1/cytochrome c oxidase subunit I+III
MTVANPDGLARGPLASAVARNEAPAPEGPFPPTMEMLAEPVPPEVAHAQAERLRQVWESPKGWRYWSDVNNQTVGVWYVTTCFAFMLAAGVLALLMRVQLAVPENEFLSAETYNQFFTMHGSAMMFLFAVPMFEAVSILLLPTLLGARDLPFPRLSAFGYWSFLIGGVFVLGSVLFGAAPNGGWFMYPPLSTQQEGVGPDIWLLGLSFIEVASIAAAVELIVGVLKCRPPGMRVNLMPLYAWYVLVVGGMILFAFPPLIAGDFLFELQHTLDWPFFDPERGGDPLLWQHLFWIFGHPEVYIIFLPSIALTAMIVPTFARTPIVGYSWIVLSAVETGFLSFGLWVHHMFTTGLPAMSLGFFSAASEAVVIPTGIQLFCFVATLMVGRVKMGLPMLWIAGALAIFTLGGLTGVMVAIAPFDWQAHDTYFVVAHLHYTLFGGFVFPVIAGAYYFYPIVTGKMLSERLGRWAFWLIFSGFNIAFLPMHLTGLIGMPRRVFTYPDGLGWGGLNLLSTLAAFVLAAGFLVLAWDLFRPKGRVPPAPRNPWAAGTLEWAGDPNENWGSRSVPFIATRYPVWQQDKLVERMDAGRFYLPDATEMRRETLVTSVIDARPLQVLRVPGPSWITLWAAAFTGGAFILPVFHLYWAAGVSGALATVAVLVWLYRSARAHPGTEMKDAGLGLRLPLYVSGPAAVGWWAMWITMLGDATAFASLVFGVFFYWTARPDFPPDGADHASVALALLALLALAAAWALTLAARMLNKREKGALAMLCLSAGPVLALAGGAALVASVRLPGLDPKAHVYPAMMWALVVWTAAHVVVGVLMQLFCLVGLLTNDFTPRHDAPLWNVALFWHFLGLTVLVMVAVVAGLPRLL